MKNLFIILILSCPLIGTFAQPATRAGQDFIIKFEGWHKVVNSTFTTPYICPAGVLTVGPGLTGGWIKKNQYYDNEVLRRKFGQYLRRFEKHVDGLNIPLKKHERDALISFAYNLGSIRGGFRKALKRGNKALAMRKMMLYVNAGGKRLRGLVKRRKAEVRLFKYGKYE